MSFETDGYEVCRGLIERDAVRRIRAEIVDVMKPYCDDAVGGPEDLDEAFAQVSRRGGPLRGNLLKLCSRLASLPLLLTEPGIRRKIDEVGIRTAVIQAYSVLCMEPFVEKFLFEPHQDLKQRTSLNALGFWIPLSGGPAIGGLGFAQASHKRGPLHHGVSARGHLALPTESVAGLRRVEFTDYSEGDCLLFSPYLVHWSIPNEGRSLRWTLSLKIDDVSRSSHLSKSMHPFVIEEYIDTRSNEERIAEAAQRKPSRAP